MGGKEKKERVDGSNPVSFSACLFFFESRPPHVSCQAIFRGFDCSVKSFIRFCWQLLASEPASQNSNGVSIVCLHAQKYSMRDIPPPRCIALHHCGHFSSRNASRMQSHPACVPLNDSPLGSMPFDSVVLEKSKGKIKGKETK